MTKSKPTKKARPEPLASPDNPVALTENVASTFPVVGLGASTGGLEAFEQFPRHAPPHSGMAVVLVSHLDPSHASIQTEILQRSTRMPVFEAHDQMKVEPNHVYVIPPNRDMAIFRGALQLNVPEQPSGYLAEFVSVTPLSTR